MTAVRMATLELCAAIGRDNADCAGVDAARLRFQGMDKLHGAHFGRAGDGGAGKQRAENSDKRGISFGRNV